MYVLRCKSLTFFASKVLKKHLKTLSEAREDVGVEINWHQFKFFCSGFGED